MHLGRDRWDAQIEEMTSIEFEPGLRRRRRLHNRLQSALLIVGMAALLAACGWLVAGSSGLWLAAFFGTMGLLSLNAVSSGVVLHLFGARPLPHDGLEAVHEIISGLSARAGLERRPRIFYVPSPLLNAFTVGRREDAALVVTSGLLQRLTLRELAGVLAHEVGHIRNDDTWVMGLADVMSRLTRSLSLLGLLLLLFNLPMTVAGQAGVPWLLVLLLMTAPALGTLLQLALSRTREYDADLQAAALTGDPEGLALALGKLERLQGRFWEDIVLPGRRAPDPSVLRSHPETAERIRRLRELCPDRAGPPLVPPADRRPRHSVLPASPRRPRWRRSGLWY